MHPWLPEGEGGTLLCRCQGATWIPLCLFPWFGQADGAMPAVRGMPEHEENGAGPAGSGMIGSAMVPGRGQGSFSGVDKSWRVISPVLPDKSADTRCVAKQIQKNKTPRKIGRSSAAKNA